MEHNKANLTPLSILKYLSTEVTMAEGDWNLGTKIWLIKSPKQAPFLIIIIIIIIIIILFLLFLLSFRGPWTCPRQISGTTGQNFMTLCGVIDICF